MVLSISGSLLLTITYQPLNFFKLSPQSLSKKSTPENSVCEKHFGDFPVNIALQSFAGSGNTWVRYLIEQSFGYYTGSVYMDKKLYEGGLLGEFQTVLSQTTSSKTIVQKIHHKRRDALSLSYFETTTNCVMLFRSPKEAFLAEYKRTHQNEKLDVNENLDSHIGDVEVDTSKFKKFFKNKSSTYISDNVEFLEHCGNVHLMFYDDLKKNLVHEMEKLGKFLSNVYNNDKARSESYTGGQHTVFEFPVRIECLGDTEGSFHRKSEQTNAEKYAVYSELDSDQIAEFNFRLRNELIPVMQHSTGCRLPDSFYL